MIRIEIETGNAAFHAESSDGRNGNHDDVGPEVGRILRNFAGAIESGRATLESDDECYMLFDTNGNRCGKVTVTE